MLGAVTLKSLINQWISGQSGYLKHRESGKDGEMVRSALKKIFKSLKIDLTGRD